jgi:hypothetical protein
MMGWNKFEIEVTVLARVTYSTVSPFPTSIDAHFYAEAMVMKDHYINWDEKIDEVSMPQINVRQIE